MRKSALRHPSIIGTAVNILTDDMTTHIGTVRMFANDCLRLDPTDKREANVIPMRAILDVRPA